MKPRVPLEPGQRATTPNGAPYPLRSWVPDAAIDIQNLANWVDPFKPQTLQIGAGVKLPAAVNNLPSGSWQRLVMSTTEYTSGGATASNGVITIPTTGYYLTSYLVGRNAASGAQQAVNRGTDAVTETTVTMFNGGSTELYVSGGIIEQYTAGKKLSLWVLCSVANNPVASAFLRVKYLGTG